MDLFRSSDLGHIADTLVLSDSPEVKFLCHTLAFEACAKTGIFSASIRPFYASEARRNWLHMTVPAVNLRTLTYDLARIVFRSARKIDAGAFIFELARSEMDYTSQTPQDYAASVLLAAVAEGHRGPVFIQGDHFQVKLKRFQADRGGEIKALKTLIEEAVQAGFHNIDIDSSTLVDLSPENVSDQQRLNYEICAELTECVRGLQPPGIDIALGGEIGEVGGRNSTPGELRAFMEGYLERISRDKGLSKISIQTGTSHGGVVLADGSMASVRLDFPTLKKLSRIAREEYGMAGAVQHGASTLPKEAFSQFPVNDCAEVHLATQFQNIVFDCIPDELKEDIYDWLRRNKKEEQKTDQTEEQFLYKTRKKALGPFRNELHGLSSTEKTGILEKMEKEFDFLFDRLNIRGSAPLVNKHILPPPNVEPPESGE
jgi:fructose/tagatose bisphosphate aldolase